MNQWFAAEESELESIARQILEENPSVRVFNLNGDLGAGKTTLVKAFAKALKADDSVSSPTFAIAQEYNGVSSIYHIDLYRIKDKSELLEIGFEEYLDSKHFVFIEWPDIALDTIKLYNPASISISIADNNNRMIILDI